VIRAGIVLSLGVFGNFLTVYLAAYFVEVSQVMPMHASIGFISRYETALLAAAKCD
jgi:hypothetical protein